MTAWYEANRSRTATMTSEMVEGEETAIPNGNAVRERTRFVETFLDTEPRPRATSSFAPTSILRRDDVLPEDEIRLEVDADNHGATVSKF